MWDADRGRAPTSLIRIAELGVLPGDTEAERLQKGALTLTSIGITIVATVWVVTYWSLGLVTAALIPLGYQVASLLSLAHFVTTKRYAFFRAGQLLLMLLLPFLLQWTLGGFVASSGVSIWALMSPIGALAFAGTHQSLRWFAAYVGLIAVSGFLEGSLAGDAAVIPAGVRAAFLSATSAPPPRPRSSCSSISSGSARGPEPRSIACFSTSCPVPSPTGSRPASR